jgi:hypothetical protein
MAIHSRSIDRKQPHHPAIVGRSHDGFLEDAIMPQTVGRGIDNVGVVGEQRPWGSNENGPSRGSNNRHP